MLISEFKSKYLLRTTHLAVSDKYIVTCTGRRVFICDKSFNLIKEYTGLSYAYKSRISPDEKHLAIVSTGNYFYLVDLESFEIKKHTLRGKYNQGLEMQGCWSFDSKFFYVLAKTYKKGIVSALRGYHIYDNMSYIDYCPDIFWFLSIKPVKELNKYLLLGLHRRKQMIECEDCMTLIWFDGETFEIYPMPELYDYDVVYSADYDPSTKNVIFYADYETVYCDQEGNNVRKVSARKNDLCNIPASFADIKGINQIRYSEDNRYAHVATKDGLLIIDQSNNETIAEKKIAHGAGDFRVISERFLAVSTWDGIKIFEIIE